MPDNHDLFLITPNRELTHVKVDHLGVPSSIHRDVSPAHPGHRKVMKLARLGDRLPRGPGFSILPNRPDPDASQMSCFLINPENLRAANPWTAAEWSQSEDGEDQSLAFDHTAPEFQTPEFEALLAGPRGRVYFARCQENGDVHVDRIADQLLAKESELWSQLRNGLVAGCVSYANHPEEPGKTVAAFNITSVLPRRQQ